MERNWPDLLQHCKGSDEAMIEKWDDEINYLLVYVGPIFAFFRFGSFSHVLQAGLFSAVVTAFVVESYQLLQPDNGDITTSALVAISEQLQFLSTGSGSATMFRQPPNTISAAAIALNAVRSAQVNDQALINASSSGFSA
jgi:hypothetical protein